MKDYLLLLKIVKSGTLQMENSSEKDKKVNSSKKRENRSEVSAFTFYMQAVTIYSQKPKLTIAEYVCYCETYVTLFYKGKGKTT